MWVKQHQRRSIFQKVLNLSIGHTLPLNKEGATIRNLKKKRTKATMDNVNIFPETSQTYISTCRFTLVQSQQLRKSFMILICDANSPIFQNYVQPKISPQRFASAPVLPPMHSRSGSKYAFGNQHMSNCQHVDVFIARI